MGNNQCYVDRLKQRGVRVTAVRILVLKAMIEEDRAVSLLDLETKLETVDRSTIFRTLSVFLAHHVIHDMEDGSGSVKYEVCFGKDSCSIDDMHIHFYCEVCHRTYCFHSLHIPVVKLPEGFNMHGVNYMVKGVCKACTDKRTISE